MEVLYPICCGLDVHKQMLTACLSVVSAEGQRSKETRTYLTLTDDLVRLGDWLKAAGCPIVAMESTGVYWKPVYNILAGKFEVLVVNAAQIKALSTDY